VKNWKR